MAKNILIYFIPVILVAIACISGSAMPDTPLHNACTTNNTMPEAASYHIDTPTTDTTPDLHLPRQVSYAKIIRSHNTSKRTTTAQRSSYTHTIAGRNTNARIITYIQRKSLNTHLSFAGTTQQLISFGKLVI